MPFCTDLWQLYLCSVISQTGAGAFESGNTIWVVEMWKQDSAPVLQLTKAFYGVGTIVAPLLAKPYLFGKLDLKNETDILLNINSTMTNDQFNESIDRRPELKNPFLYAGVITLSGK